MWAKLLVGGLSLTLFFGLGWYLYQRATFFSAADSAEEAHKWDEVLQDQDTLLYKGFLIRRTEIPAKSGSSAYGLEISRNGNLYYRHSETVAQKEFIEMGLAALLGDDNKQLIIQQFTGGTHCCWNSWVLDIGDSVRILFRSKDYAELGYEMGFMDMNEDGVVEITQTILLFDSFDRLDFSQSPFPTAYFEYSNARRRYELAKTLSSIFLAERIDEMTQNLDNLKNTRRLHTDSNATGDYFAHVLAVTLEYVYAGQLEKGWIFFDQWYTHADKSEMKRKIRTLLESSAIFQELYAIK